MSKTATIATANISKEQLRQRLLRLIIKNEQERRQAAKS
jgi:hypothetical protein